MKKLVIVLPFILILILGTLSFNGCKNMKVNENLMNDDISGGFFVWMDAYVALPIDDEFEIALSYYYFSDTDNYIHEDEISKVSFQNLSAIKVNGYRIEELDCDEDAYKGYTIILKISPVNLGVYSTDSVIVQIEDGTRYVCSLGSWYFDVDDSDSGKVDAYSSTVASGIETNFKYNYVLDDESEIIELQYWHNQRTSGKVAISDTLTISSEAPFNYVKTKGIVESNGQEYRFYGLGSYCGILNASVDDLEKSYEHNRQMK